MIEVELYSKPGCGLCDEMKQALFEAARGLRVRVTEVDISRDEALMERYGLDIPVLFINGSKAAKHRASVSELAKRLRIADRESREKKPRSARRRGAFLR